MAGGLQREPDGAWWERTPGSSLPELIAGLHDGKVAFAAHRLFTTRIWRTGCWAA